MTNPGQHETEVARGIGTLFTPGRVSHHPLTTIHYPLASCHLSLVTWEVRLHLEPMKIPLFLVTTILVTASSAQAQIRVSGRLGAVWSSKLSTDQIVEPIDVKAGIGPSLALGLSIPSGKRFRLGLEAALSTSSVKASAPSGESDLGSLRTASILITAEGPLMASGLYWRAGAGILKYLPSRKEGLFQQGGSARLTGSLAVEYRRLLSPLWEGTAGVRYSLHQFTTRQLEASGFSRGQAVHRVGVELGAARYF